MSSALLSVYVTHKAMGAALCHNPSPPQNHSRTRQGGEMRNTFATAAVTAIVLMVTAGGPALGAQASIKTASEFYMSFRAAFQKAKAVEEILPYMSKAVRSKIEATPAAERAKMFEFQQEMSKMSGVKVLKETKTDDGATLTVEGIADKEKMTGQIQIVKEDGEWKIGKESWSNKS